MSFVTETKTSILISWIVWLFFFVTVFVTRLFFSLPEVFPGVYLFYIGISGMVLTGLIRFVIWLFRNHKFVWILSGLVNLSLVAIILFFVYPLGFNEYRHIHDWSNNPTIHQEEKIIQEDGVKKVLTIKGDVKISKTQHGWLMVYLMILGIVYTVTALIELNEQKMNHLVLKDKLLNAKLNTLRAQLNPHFMFNALNTVSSLIEEDKKEAQQVLEDFSFLLRDVIDKSKEEFTIVSEEVSFIKRYALIEKKRFTEKLSLQFDIEKDALSGKVPAMILQPIVENAIKHGVLKKEGKGEVVVSIKRKEDRLLLSVKDDGEGAQPEKIKDRVGLNNTKVRLHHLYKNHAFLEMDKVESGGLLVTINLPFENL